jgi:hypothetical protein
VPNLTKSDFFVKNGGKNAHFLKFFGKKKFKKCTNKAILEGCAQK